MVKAKTLKNNKGKAEKQQLRGIKDGSIKKKDSKFKNTLNDKVISNNNSKNNYTSNKGKAFVKTILDETYSSPKPIVPSNYINIKRTPNKNKGAKKYQDQKPISTDNAKQSKQNSPNKTQKQSTNSSKAPKNNKKTVNFKKMEKQFVEPDITEEEDNMNTSSDEAESDSESDTSNILGKLLEEDSYDDDDDEDYEEDEEIESEDDEDDDDDDSEEETEDDEEMIEPEVVERSKGLQSKTKKNKKDQKKVNNETESDTSENDDDDESDTTDEEMEKEKSTKNFKVVTKDEDNNSKKEGTNSKKENNDINKESSESCMTDEDDSDELFSSDCSSDFGSGSSSDERVDDEAYIEEIISIGKFRISRSDRDYLAKRIVLIDNIYKNTNASDILDICSRFGEVDLFEARPYPAFFLDNVDAPGTLKEWIELDYPHLSTYSANVLFSTPKDAKKAVKYIQGLKFQGHYLNVVTAFDTEKEPNYAVYVTDLKEGIEDNALWYTFKRCGKIKCLRNVRDPLTGISKGYGYVAFKSIHSTKCALAISGVTLGGKQVKVQPYPYNKNASRDNLIEGIRRKKHGIKRVMELKRRMELNRMLKKRPFKRSLEESAVCDVEKSVKGRKKQQGDKEENKEKSTAFQGQMVDLKNKKKKKKFNKKKKIMAEKLTAKSTKKI
ncbi:PREDICTED: nucleolin-like [Cyphomyrmex costatus]|uniref:nucleolin-like n=1 Tax=Cyphomyrmex costatus TaxID=456900 RepID=UPI0008522362|nr:PREDICTED: nucleolin-like [Cyphomyrmex costatus]